MSPKLPVVFIFDLDSTLIASAESLTSYFDFIRFLRDAIMSKKIEIPGVTLASVRSRPLSEIVPIEFFRCQLAETMAKIKELFPTAEIFVFSAGTKNYVEQLVGIMEKRLGISIHRPIFSRYDCTIDETNNYKKSIQTVLPRIIASLQGKYPALKEAKSREKLLAHNLVFIDDSDVVWDLKEKWIPCPDYLYEHFIDITKGVPRAVLEHKLVREYIKTRYAGFIEPPAGVSEDERSLMYHAYLAHNYQRTFGNNREALKDDFFPRWIKALKPISQLQKPFTEKTLDRIRKELKPK